MYHSAILNILFAVFALPQEEVTKQVLQEDNLLADWFYSMVSKYPYNPEKKATFWVVCVYGHMYKLLIESQKKNLGIFDDIKSTDPKLRKIFDEFLAPKIIAETKEFSKEKSNVSDIVENEEEVHGKSDATGHHEELTRQFTDTHFPGDFKITLNEEVSKALDDLNEGAAENEHKDDEMVQIDKTDMKEKKQIDDLEHWKMMMAYSNRQIEAFVGGKEKQEEQKASNN